MRRASTKDTGAKPTMRKRVYHKSVLIAVMLGLLLPSLAQAEPSPGGPPGPGPGAPWDAPAPGMPVAHLPLGVETVIVAGLTYYMLNGIFYQRHNDGYVVVETPNNSASAVTTPGGTTVLDLNGQRFYVKNGSYYQRNINGEYIEVPKPPGL